MSTHDDPRPTSTLLVRFCDGFLQERNIKWVLATGVIILLGSSLMMVSTQWRAIADSWKYSIFLGYTHCFAAAGYLAYARLGLRKTGAFLRALTVLIIPITFFAWNWLIVGAVGTSTVLAMALLVVALVFACFTSDRIFSEFLCGRQVTLQVAYLTLAFAAVLGPIVKSGEPYAAVSFAFVTWLIATIGVVKASRHVFWLTEERRAPRAYGFLPVALLGGQFLTLFFAYCGAHFSVSWIGFACQLTAIPILLTGDAVAAVHLKRHGSFSRPWPWPIVLPIATGLMLSMTGLVLASSDLFAGRLALAMTPTAVLAAILFGVVAYRTQRTLLAWMTLATLVLAYNFSPAYFMDWTRSAMTAGANAVQEPSLPYAFYGLTYLPLIAAGMAVSRLLKQGRLALFADPAKHFAGALSIVLWIACFTHSKAILPVSAAMTVLFFVQAFVARDRRWVLMSIASLLATTLSGPLFAEQVLLLAVPKHAMMLSLIGVGFGLLMTSRLVDPILAALPCSGMRSMADSQRPVCEERLLECASALIAVGAALMWISAKILPFSDPAPWLPGLLIGALLMLHSVRWFSVSLSTYSYAFVMCLAYSWAVEHLTTQAVLSALILQLFVQWLVVYGLERRPDWRVSRAYGQVLKWSAILGMTGTLLFVVWPGLMMEIFFAGGPHVQLAWLPCYVLATVWSFDIARKLGWVEWEWLAAATMLPLGGAFAARATGDAAWAYPAVPVRPSPRRFGGGSILSQPRNATFDTAAASHWPTSEPQQIAANPVLLTACWSSGAIASLTLAAFSPASQVAGWLAVVGMFAATAGGPAIASRVTLILATWHVLRLLVCCFIPASVDSFITFIGVDAASAYAPLALGSAIFALLWRPSSSSWPTALTQLRRGQQFTLAGVGAGCLALIALFRLSNSWSPALVDLVLLSVVFGLVVARSFQNGLEQKSEAWIWTALSTLAAAIGYFALLDVVPLIGLFMAPCLLALALVFEVLARCSRSTFWTIATNPFSRTADALPAVAVAITCCRFLLVGESWLGVNSLYMMLAGGFYFWRAVERRRVAYGVAAGVVGNLALLFLWRELRWTDPQLYMIPLGASVLAFVEMLKREIPESARNPLRYVAALIVLVSPTFHIVTGSWLHLFSLMVVSVLVLLTGIGLRVRALIYTGAAFLIADFLAILVRGCVDDPARLWIAGIALGIGVIAIGAIAENNRERVLQRLRRISAELETWS